MRYVQYLLASMAFHGLGDAVTSGPQFNRRKFDSVRDVHLGTLRSLDDFYERLGTNTSDWEIFQEEHPEPLTERAYWDDPASLKRSARTGLMSRQDDKCASKTGIEYYVCEALPNRAFIWTAGIAVIIYWAPDLIDKFLDSCARLYFNGINMGARYQRIQGGAEGPVAKLKVRDINLRGLDLEHLDLESRGDDFNPEYVHFNIENEMVGMAKRDLDGIHDGIDLQARSYTHFALNPRTGEIQTRGIDATLSHDATEQRQKRGVIPAAGSGNETTDGVISSQMASNMPEGFRAAAAAEEWHDWSLIITADRESNYFPTSSIACIKDWLYDRLRAAGTAGSHSCMHMSEDNMPNSYFTHSGVFINHGGNNFGLPFGDCCP